MTGKTIHSLNIGKHLSLKARLLIVIVGALFISLIGEVYLQVHSWKKAIRLEVDSSISLAQRLVGSGLIQSRDSVEAQSAVVGALEGLRHIRVLVKYQHEPILPTEQTIFEKAGVPDWFVRLIYPYDDSLPRVTISSKNYTTKLIIEADPRDEIIEVWEDFSTQLSIILIFSLFVSILLYFGLHIGLNPLNELLAGFEKLESGSFDVKLREDLSTELSRINQKFNHMVTVLRRTSEDNSLLTRKMVSLQEDERKEITRELHDEMAPHLFGLRVSMSKSHALVSENQLDALPATLNEMDRIVENLQNQMRRLLARLRPMVLDDLEIEQALRTLIERKEIAQSGIDWNLDFKALNTDLDDTVTVTLYRIVQECVTNIVRHSKATKADLVVETDSNNILRLLIEDNGVGLSDTATQGFGLIGMRERVQALGGSFEVSNTVTGGVRITALIPL